MHTHPSVRIGMVLAGHGDCFWRTEKDKNYIEPTELKHGACFWLEAETEHHFNTYSSSLTVIAYHPDSDVGMDNDNHPMLNRTVIGGTSANQLRAKGLA